MKVIIEPPTQMILSLMGFIFSAVYTFTGSFESFFLEAGFRENFGLSMGFSFCLAFLMMFIAAFINSVPPAEEISRYK